MTRTPTHYIDLVTGQKARISLVPMRKLAAILKSLAYSHMAKTFLEFNSEDVVRALCREARSRRQCRKNVLIYAAQLDPPPCRCGKPGTRYLGFATFCRHCGPPTDALKIQRETNQRLQAQSRDIEQHQKSFDDLDARRRRIKNSLHPKKSVAW